MIKDINKNIPVYMNNLNISKPLYPVDGITMKLAEIHIEDIIVNRPYLKGLLTVVYISAYIYLISIIFVEGPF